MDLVLVGVLSKLFSFSLTSISSGKGTQCSRIAQVCLLTSEQRLTSVYTFGYVHLSAGDLLREEAAKPDSPLDKQINDHITNVTRDQH